MIGQCDRCAPLSLNKNRARFRARAIVEMPPALLQLPAPPPSISLAVFAPIALSGGPDSQPPEGGAEAGRFSLIVREGNLRFLTVGNLWFYALLP